MASNGSNMKEFRNNIKSHDFAIVSKIGNGNFGTVYKVFDKQTTDFCAVKSISLDSECDVEQLKAKMQTLETLSNENIVNIIGTGLETSDHAENQRSSFESPINLSPQHPNRILLLMELCDQQLSQCVEKYRNDAYLRINIMKQIVNALYYLKNEGVVHRNVTLGNILIDKNGTAKLSDYALGHENMKDCFSDFEDNNSVKTDDFSNTWKENFHVAPEILQSILVKNAINNDDLDKADIYDLGITWLQLCVDPKFESFLQLLSYFNKGCYSLTYEGITGKEIVLMAKILHTNSKYRLSIDKLHTDVIKHDLSKCELIYNRCTKKEFVERKLNSKNECNTKSTSHDFSDGHIRTHGYKDTFIDHHLRNRIAKKEATCEKKDDKIEQMITEQTLLAEKNSALKANNSYLKSCLNDEYKELNRFKDQYELSEIKCELMFEEKADFSRQNAVLETDFKYLRSANKLRKDKHKKFESEFKLKNKKIGDMTEHENTLIKETVEFRTSNKGLRKSNEETKKENETLYEDSKCKAEQIEELNDDIVTLAGENACLEYERDYFTVAVSNTKQQVAEEKEEMKLDTMKMTEHLIDVNDALYDKAYKSGYDKGATDKQAEAYNRGFDKGREAGTTRHTTWYRKK